MIFFGEFEFILIYAKFFVIYFLKGKIKFEI
jgi:hypothetical protein